MILLAKYRCGDPVVIVVVGGGLAGLRAALTVQGSGQQVHLLEGRPTVGGRLTSSTIEGFTIDRGFQVINPGYSEFTKLDIRTRFHSIPAGAVAMVGGRSAFFGDPRREIRTLVGALPTIAGDLLPFLSLLRAISLAKVHSGESAAVYLQRIGVRAEVFESIVEPFLRGVFLTSLEEVDARFAKRVLRSLYKNVPGLPDGGVIAIALELRNRLKSIQCVEEVQSISRKGKGFVVQSANGEISARKVIVATDHQSAQKFSKLLPQVDFAHSFSWYFTLEERLPRQHQLHVAASKSGPVVSAVDVASVVPSYSPDGRGLLSVTTLSEATEGEVRNHLERIYGQIVTGQLLTQFEIKNALPIIPPGAKRSGIIDDDGLIFAGDYLTEPSQNGALLSGRLAGERAIDN